jgi:CHAT domain
VSARRPAGGRRRGAAGAGTPDIPPEFLTSDVRVEEVLEVIPTEAAVRRSAPPDLVIDVDLQQGEAGLLAIRHPSGALTFHPSVDGTARSRPRSGRRGGGPTTAQFRVPIRRVAAASGRRGLVSKAVRVFVIKVVKAAVDQAVSLALPKLAAMWEARIWAGRQLEEGWFHVAAEAGKSPGIRLTPGLPPTLERTLLFLHGTFSNAASAFGPLSATGFFDRARLLYGDRIYAFNHFSLSRTPEENAHQLLSALPAGEHRCDVITHSRGGLVLRSLVEHGQKHGPLADRFRLGHAVLVASPNDGTPLATPQRWEETVGWFANVLEVFPDNPFTTGAEFVSEALVWLASHLAGDLPGLRAMDGAGNLIVDLQAPPGPPTNAYSALVSNVHPEDALWERALDVGVDEFFGTANDLVVPSEGGWRIDRDGTPHIPGSRIGCFGPGGNISTAGTNAVTHVSFFNRPETAEFLIRALAHEPHKLAAINPDLPLPDRRFTKKTARAIGSRADAAESALVARAADTGQRTAQPLSSVGALPGELRRLQDDIDTFHIVVMDAFDARSGGQSGPAEFARVFASYAGARVVETLRLRAGRDGKRTVFGEIIRVHERIKNYTNREKGSLPSDPQMMRFGGQLFETLFQGNIRRLYDEARSRQRKRRLDLVLTSMIPWIAEKPWEFAYDTVRESFLATEEIHFVRNVLTAIPADPIEPCVGPLRILVASAQPVGFGQLSIPQEEEVIRRGFEPLIEAGLVTVDVLPRATPAAIHGYLSTGDYTVVHFIGHGVFDDARGEGCLVFEDSRGGAFSLGERSVREIFCQRGVSLVFLNACQSGTGGRADFNKGVAQALVAHGLPSLVANQYSVLDSSATSFAQHFYWSLAQGMTIGESAREARIAVNYSLHGESIDWAVPVVYARDANRALCPRTAERLKVPSTGVRATNRRAVAGRSTRVAVWDVDHVFPDLQRTLDRMNAAQQVFGFELVDMSAPLDIWDLEETDGVPYLHAERLARRLQNKTVELRVDLLTCVTRHWLRDDDWLNLYAWWPAGRTPPVAVFSCAGFDALPVEGRETDRAVANNMAAVLAGFFGDEDTHARVPKDCPLWFNEDRVLEHLTGRQTFDPVCRKKLRATMSKELPALDALLETFA